MVNTKTDKVYAIEGEVGQVYLNSIFVARLLKDDKILIKHLIMGMLLDSDCHFAKDMKIYGVDFFKLYINELCNVSAEKKLNPLFVTKGENVKDAIVKHVDYSSDRYIVVSEEVRNLIDSSNYQLSRLEESIKRFYFSNTLRN